MGKDIERASNGRQIFKARSEKQKKRNTFFFFTSYWYQRIIYISDKSKLENKLVSDRSCRRIDLKLAKNGHTIIHNHSFFSLQVMQRLVRGNSFS